MAGLRAQLREVVAAAAGVGADWATLAVDGLTEAPGIHGRTWVKWTATVKVGRTVAEN